MKNTAYALAAAHLTGSIEDFATVLGRHFLDFDQVDRSTVNIREHAWQPIDVGGRPAPDAFVRSGRGHASPPWPSDGTRPWSRPASRTWS